LAYPPVARLARVQGIVVIKVTFNDQGEVTSASAIAGRRTLIPHFLANAKKWRFKPGAQKSAVIVYQFKLDDGACQDDSHSLFRLLYGDFASITACAPVLR
jgi:TonB family protein